MDARGPTSDSAVILGRFRWPIRLSRRITDGSQNRGTVRGHTRIRTHRSSSTEEHWRSCGGTRGHVTSAVRDSKSRLSQAPPSHRNDTETTDAHATYTRPPGQA